MMKNTNYVLLILACLWTYNVRPLNIRQLNPATIVKSITKQFAERPYYNTAKYALIAGLGIWAIRCINDQRNTQSSYIIGEEELEGTKYFSIKSDGPVTVRAGTQKRPSIRGEAIDLDSKTASTPYQQLPPQLPLSWLEKIWYRLCEPAHRRVNHLVVTLPKDKPVKVVTTNKHGYAHRCKNLITIENMGSTIHAEAHSGDIHITNPAGHVTVKGRGSLTIENFKNVVCAADGFHHLRATRAKKNSTYGVYINGTLSEHQDIYDTFGDDD